MKHGIAVDLGQLDEFVCSLGFNRSFRANGGHGSWTLKNGDRHVILRHPANIDTPESLLAFAQMLWQLAIEQKAAEDAEYAETVYKTNVLPAVTCHIEDIARGPDGSLIITKPTKKQAAERKMAGYAASGGER